MWDVEGFHVSHFNVDYNESLLSMGAEKGDLWFFPKDAKSALDIKEVPAKNFE